MNCDYKIIETKAGVHTLKCRREHCGHVTKSKYLPQHVHTSCRDRQAERKQQTGIGNTLHLLLHDRLGVGFKKGCSCQKVIKCMNEWGPRGCRENLVRIVNALLAEAKRREWKLDGRPLLSKAASIGTKLPLGIIIARTWARRLVLEAIERSEHGQ